MPDSDATQVSIRHRAGPLELNVEFALEAPWTTLFAPSGAGKTTILRMIAGLQDPTSGRILLAGGLLALDTALGKVVPSHRRDVLMVSQRPALFPHLSVIQNVKYGMHWSQLQDDVIDGSYIDKVMDICRIPLHLRDETPANLSGGERQRVALARAMGRGSARLLLLDEPFTGLEADLRDDIMRDLRDWTSYYELPVLHVTHDIGEVFAAQAHVLKMANGRIVASGPADEVLADERSRLLQRLEQRQNGPNE